MQGSKNSFIANKCQNRVDRAIRVAQEAFSKAEKVNAEIYHIHDPELLGIAVKLKKMGKRSFLIVTSLRQCKF